VTEVEHFFVCPYCGESISMLIDLNFNNQKYIEDCEICCRPIELSFSVNDNMINSWGAYRID